MDSSNSWARSYLFHFFLGSKVRRLYIFSYVLSDLLRFPKIFRAASRWKNLKVIAESTYLEWIWLQTWLQSLEIVPLVMWPLTEPSIYDISLYRCQMQSWLNAQLNQKYFILHLNFNTILYWGNWGVKISEKYGLCLILTDLKGVHSKLYLSRVEPFVLKNWELKSCS